MTTGSTSVVVVVASTDLLGGGDRALGLVVALRSAGVEVEILSLTDGEDRAAFERHGVVTVVQEMPTPTIALAASTLSRRVQQWIRGRCLRRWLATRPDSPLVIGHPRAASVLRFDRRDRVSVAMLPDHLVRLDDISTVDLDSLADAAGWLVCDDIQADSIRSRFDRPSIVSPLVHGPHDPPRVHVSPRGSIVLLPDHDLWSSVDHAAEIAARLAPGGAEIKWVTYGAKDRWLARHDLTHLGSPANVRLLDSSDPDVLIGASMVIRTGYRDLNSPIVVAARRAGLPVIGFSRDVSPQSGPVAPFDAESIVERAELLHGVDPCRSGFRPDPQYGEPDTRVVSQVLAWLAIRPAEGSFHP